MVLGPKILLQLVREKKLVENLAERELTNPEGAGFDLRLGEVFKISGDAFLGVTERHTPESTSVAKYEEKSQGAKGSEVQRFRAAKGQRDKGAESQRSKKSQSFTFQPGDFYLIKTIETVNMPEDMTAQIRPRSTTFRSGIFIRTTSVHPGYSGGLIFGLKNEGPVPVTIELGARVVHIQFELVDGGGSKYRGQWQGGRVTHNKREVQV